MGDYDAVSRAVQSSIEELGPIDSLINNACLCPDNRVSTLTILTTGFIGRLSTWRAGYFS